MYQKGLALMKLGRLTDAGNEFGDVIKRFHATAPDTAAKACEQRKNMGLNCTVPPKAAAPASKKKKAE